MGILYGCSVTLEAHRITYPAIKAPFILPVYSVSLFKAFAAMVDERFLQYYLATFSEFLLFKRPASNA